MLKIFVERIVMKLEFGNLQVSANLSGNAGSIWAAAGIKNL
jgi:hypothetical protein